MEENIIVRKAFGFPGGIQRVLRNGLAVHADIDMFFFLGIGGLGIAGKPAFNPAAFVIVGAGTFLPVVAAAFVAVDKELAHIVPDAVEIFN